MLDKLKLVVAVIIVFAGVAAYYYFSDWMSLARVGAIVVSVIVAVLIAATSANGREALAFAGKAKSEAAKVVWPERKEAMQVTFMVLVGVVIAGVFIWVADWFFFKVIYNWILGTAN